jgi:membrane-bound ClpP family serine protease
MWAVIAILILVGLALLVLEILVIPGTGIVGVIGFLLMVSGVGLAYAKEGFTGGNITLLSTILLNVVSVILMLRSKTWEKAQLRTFVSGKVRMLDNMNLKVGIHGKTISRCAPTGKAVFGDNYVEVDAGTTYLKTGTTIEIIKINGNKIFVKHIKT